MYTIIFNKPDISCIAKSKINKKYEFGYKVCIVSTLKNIFILSVKSFQNKLYDGHTLKPLLEITEANTMVVTKTIILDEGYKCGKRQFPDKTVRLTRDRNLSKAMNKKLKKRSKIESVIGLAKAKCGLAKNRLKVITTIQSMLCYQLLHII